MSWWVATDDGQIERTAKLSLLISAWAWARIRAMEINWPPVPIKCKLRNTRDVVHRDNNGSRGTGDFISTILCCSAYTYIGIYGRPDLWSFDKKCGSTESFSRQQPEIMWKPRWNGGTRPRDQSHKRHGRTHVTGADSAGECIFLESYLKFPHSLTLTWFG